MAREHKLTQADIDTLVFTIKKEYDDYIIRFQKPLTVKSGFEERYLQARLSNINIRRFLHDELAMITELKRRVLSKKNRAALEKLRPQIGKMATEASAKKKDFADKILEQLHERMKPYPEVFIHEDASFDLKKLYGALRYFGLRFWPNLQYDLQKAGMPGYGRFYMQFYSKARDLWSERETDLPPLLRRYHSMLSMDPQNGDEIEKEQMHCMREAAFFFHSIRNELDRIKKNDDSSDNEAREYITKVINDFRLMHLKPQNL